MPSAIESLKVLKLEHIMAEFSRRQAYEKALRQHGAEDFASRATLSHTTADQLIDSVQCTLMQLRVLARTEKPRADVILEELQREEQESAAMVAHVKAWKHADLKQVTALVGAGQSVTDALKKRRRRWAQTVACLNVTEASVANIVDTMLQTDLQVLCEVEEAYMKMAAQILGG